MYPLGGDLYATVQRYKGSVKIHVRYYAPAPGGRVIPTTRGLCLTDRQFGRLVYIKSKLLEDYYKLTEAQNLSHPSGVKDVPYATLPSDKENLPPPNSTHAWTAIQKVPSNTASALMKRRCDHTDLFLDIPGEMCSEDTLTFE